MTSSPTDMDQESPSEPQDLALSFPMCLSGIKLSVFDTSIFKILEKTKKQTKKTQLNPAFYVLAAVDRKLKITVV